MEYKKPKIQALGEQAILLSWEEKIDEDLLYFLLYLKKEIQNYYTKVKVEVINTYNSLLIKYISYINNIYSEFSVLETIVSANFKGQKLHLQQYTLPVCYDEEFGLDLAIVSKQNKRSISEIIQLHTQSNYTIYFTGFLPGFLYLGGLDEKLYISRKESPRLKVEKGAVGIGEKQTGVYPQNSAGGWQIIGNCPVPIFDVENEKPSPFQPGDKLKFEAVSLEKYNTIKQEIKRGNFLLKKEVYEY
ncbi:5-oxoprolinase subunit PxpB [Mesonia aestuariivivens]|uniref:5-oxoprolinase subunit PxpB n=1 Tax=Mesonia aestuariivivens TaxID=2796128 RepID=A0ABS6W3R5_9FLAO|nr:5-oxoprolinase subunit PxpB [Mesonia aestuariivivens]MBW2962502.1 5-oxoprolinase subunit PxpB [Mesonia aestuariivivens]